jgi:hypothetical protein
MAGAVEESKYDDGIGPEDEEYSVRKTTGQYPAYFGTATQPAMVAGMRDGAINGGTNFGDELPAQP